MHCSEVDAQFSKHNTSETRSLIEVPVLAVCICFFLLTYYVLSAPIILGVARSSYLGDGGGGGGVRPNERVITVGIGWVLLASATSRFSGYIELAYCSSAKELQYLSGKSI